MDLEETFFSSLEGSSCSNDIILDDLNSSLNTIINSIKADTKEFPSIELLEQIKNCLECLSSSSPLELSSQRLRFVSISWPADLRVVIQRIFRTFKIPEEYTCLCYELCNFSAKCLGNEWLKSDLQFLKLLASLSSGRLKVILDEPDKVNINQLIACIQLQEFFIGCVEDVDEWLCDEDATFLSKNCQESCTFICEYVIECEKQFINFSNYSNLFLILCQYFYVFLEIGGEQILDSNLLNKVLPLFKKISEISTQEIEKL